MPGLRPDASSARNCARPSRPAPVSSTKLGSRRAARLASVDGEKAVASRAAASARVESEVMRNAPAKGMGKPGNGKPAGGGIYMTIII
ncbi:hypothetical protein F1536_07250 [Achromobacter xylosoxidans]|uniref:phage DNA packaging protein J n=1 Tax=Alcaligenes xylosoxydans xylosoxydans TaxID=85698 RepID=UPI001231F8D4|nr:hypothetical protein F1536_07250 [Achromobacter xylosoxidans]